MVHILKGGKYNDDRGLNLMENDDQNSADKGSYEGCDFDVLAMAQELKGALDDFRKVVQNALDQRKEGFRQEVLRQPVLGKEEFGRESFIQPGVGQPGFGQPGFGTVRIRAPSSVGRDGWVTSREASEYLRISPRTLGRYRQKQLIPYRLMGGTCRYRYEELVAFMERNSSKLKL